MEVRGEYRRVRSNSTTWKMPVSFLFTYDNFFFFCMYSLCNDIVWLFRKPETRCSHVSTKFKSTCHQVYNYHRLLTWDHFSGLTMDIFKVLVMSDFIWFGRRHCVKNIYTFRGSIVTIRPLLKVSKQSESNVTVSSRAPLHTNVKRLISKTFAGAYVLCLSHSRVESADCG